MTRPSWIGAPLCASALAHAALGWPLYVAPLAAHEPRALDTFEVRTIELPPEPPAPPPPLPEPPLPEPPAPPHLESRVTPKPSPRVTPKPVLPPSEPAPPPSEPTPPPSEPAPTPLTAPAALLAETVPGALGGIVQLPGTVGAWAARERAPVAPAPAAPSPASPFTKLSDLSRKPRAPELDAALRDNYPAEQRWRGVEGHAEVQVMIESDGRVGDISVLSESAAGFAEACRRTLRGSAWSEPLGHDGRPVRTRLTYRCRFRIER